MRLHKIIPSCTALTIKQLESLRLSKQQAFDNLDENFDYALPQEWLNAFTDWCKHNKSKVTYDLIRSTTVYSYNKPVGPITCCAEVYYTYKSYENSTNK